MLRKPYVIWCYQPRTYKAMGCHLVPRSFAECIGHSIQVPQDKGISTVSLHIYDTLMITNCKLAVKMQRTPCCVKIHVFPDRIHLGTKYLPEALWCVDIS
jgi:hypothetical protein